MKGSVAITPTLIGKYCDWVEKELCADATAGPWDLFSGSIVQDNDDGSLPMEWISNGNYPAKNTDGRFMAASRTLVPSMLPAMRALAGAADGLAAIQCYGSASFALEAARPFCEEVARLQGAAQ